ncbi:MAG TPA: DUF1056 family protein [Lactobacillus johnsonii]|uniref:DUF1056 family protein n=1 Tax=Lactobacillus johnsonii TaxID=33959 RepID=A0A921JN40_LACJH|nr:DUF1056 family protein [Lactobacillus johnsonii]
MRTLVTKLKQQLWKYIDVIFYFVGLAGIVFGTFKINEPLGYIAGGVAFLVSGYLVELIAAGGEKGGGK